MATSRNTGHRTRRTDPRNVLRGMASLSRYDVVLAAIPLVFALALSVHALAGVPLHPAITAAAVTGTLLLVDAIYLNPPADTGSDGSGY